MACSIFARQTTVTCMEAATCLSRCNSSFNEANEPQLRPSVAEWYVDSTMGSTDSKINAAFFKMNLYSLKNFWLFREASAWSIWVWNTSLIASLENGCKLTIKQYQDRNVDLARSSKISKRIVRTITNTNLMTGWRGMAYNFKAASTNPRIDLANCVVFWVKLT